MKNFAYLIATCQRFVVLTTLIFEESKPEDISLGVDLLPPRLVSLAYMVFGGVPLQPSSCPAHSPDLCFQSTSFE